MASFSAGTTFTDGVANDVTAAKLAALVNAATPTSGLIQDRTAETTIASNDTLLFGDASASDDLKRITVSNLFKTDVSITSATGTAGTVAIGPTGDTNTGIFFPAADTIAFSEGGAEAMRIDSSGNVGIGTVSPINKLHLYNGTASVGATQLELEGRFSGYGAGINFSSRTSDGGTLVAMAKITADGEASWNTTGTTQDAGLRFSTTQDGTLTERLRIDSSGNVGIGSTNPQDKLDLGNPSAGLGITWAGTGGTSRYNSIFSSFSVAGLVFSSGFHGSASADSYISSFTGTQGLAGIRLDSFGANAGTIGFFTNATAVRTAGAAVVPTERLRIDSSGNVGIGMTPTAQLELSTDSAKKPSTNTWTIASDQRLKTNIVNADNDRCYEIVKQVPLKRYTWKNEVYSQEQVNDRSKLGWIAQDVEAVFPKAVGTNRFAYNQVFEDVVTPELDSDGNAVLDENGVAKTKTEKRLVSEEVIEDCKDLNSDQIYAAMYGTIQKLIEKVETLEAKVAVLEAA